MKSKWPMPPTLLVGSIAVMVACHFVPMEERAIEKAFGDDWRGYRKRVRRWL